MGQCVAGSAAGLIQYVATNLLTSGYRWYVTGWVPDRKAPEAVDAKLVAKYELDLPKWERSRRKRIGWASIRYVRHDRFFVMLATEGVHRWKLEEGSRIRDVRTNALKYGGYAVTIRRDTSPNRRGAGRWRVRVSIEAETYKRLKAYFLDLAVHRSVEELAAVFGRVPFEPYAPVRRQLLTILNAVNRARKKAGYRPVPSGVLRYRRRPVRVFEDDMGVETAPVAIRS